MKRMLQGHRPIHSGPVRLAALALLAAALLASGGASPDEAVAKVPKGAVKKLREAQCPPRYAVRVARLADRSEIRAAKRGTFRIAGVDVHISRRMDWTFDPLGSASFRGRLHDLRWLDTLLYAYRSNGDLRALRRAKRIVVDWVKQNPRRAPTTDRTWFDKVVGDRAPYIAYVTRAAKCEGMIKQGKLARRLLGSIDQHADFLRDPDRYTVTNRGLFMDLGLIFTGRQARFLPGANRSRKRGQRRFVDTVDRLTDFHEAFWREHSTTYQFLVINVLGRFLEIDKRDRPALEQLLENMKETAGWLTMPDQRWVQAGDSYQDRSSAFARQAGRRDRGLRVLPKSGIAFVKKRGRYLSLLSNFHRAEHKHSDELSFDLFEKERRIVSDTGMPNKDPGKPYAFAQSAAAHSVLTVDGAELSRDAADAYGSGIVASGEGDGWFAIEATNPLLARQGVQHSRLLLYRPGFTLIVADRVRSGESHSYRSYLHFGPDFRLHFQPDRLLLRDGSYEVSVFHSSSAPDLVRRAVRGRTEPLQGFVYPAFRERDPRWTAWSTVEGRDVDNVTTLALKAKREARATATGPLGATSAFEITENGEQTRALTVRRDGDRLAISQQRLDYEQP